MSGPGNPAEREQWEEFVRDDNERAYAEIGGKRAGGSAHVHAHARRGTRGVRAHERRIAWLRERARRYAADVLFYEDKLSHSDNPVDHDYYEQRLNESRTLTRLADLEIAAEK